MTTRNGYRYAELEPGESFQSPDVCDCCGREGLKRTVKLVNPAGRSVWFGVGCAARAMSVGVDEVRAARKDAEARAWQNEQKARDEARRAADEPFQAFLNDAAGTGPDVAEWEGGQTSRFKQLEKLGGYAAARALYAAKASG